MAGAGVEVRMDEKEYQTIVDALHRASGPDLKRIAHAAGLALQAVTQEAFKNETSPEGKGWEKLKFPRGSGAKKPGSTGPILHDRGTLKKSITFNAFDDGSVIIGSNLVYAAIHQWGGKTRAHEIRARHGNALHFNGKFFKSVKHPGSDIPPRPFLGVPDGFQESFFADPAIKKVLGIAVGAEA